MEESDSETLVAGEKEKHSLSVFRSQGASRKMKYLMKYCKESGYSVLLVLKPTWPRGKPRALKSYNFTGPILVPKNGEEGTGLKQLKELELAESSESEGEVDQGYGDVRGSPRSSRPLGKEHKKKGKRAKKEEIIRCHACGEVYNEKQSKEDEIMWVYCGGDGPRGKGCTSFYAHATCWNISGGRKAVNKMSKFYIRCKDCQAREDESSEDDEPPPSRSHKKNSTEGKRKKSSQPGTSNARNHQNSREDDEDSPPIQQHSTQGKHQQSATNSSQPGTSTASNHQKSRGLHKSNSQSGSRTAPPMHPASDDDFQT